MEPTSSAAAGTAAILKSVGLPAAMGMLGAAMLYVAMPPLNKQKAFDRREFVLRLAFAGVVSVVFGDMAADTLHHYFEFIDPEKHGSAIDLMTGAPGWWASRAVALWFHNNRKLDIGALITKLRGG